MFVGGTSRSPTLVLAAATLTAVGSAVGLGAAFGVGASGAILYAAGNAAGVGYAIARPPSWMTLAVGTGGNAGKFVNSSGNPIQLRGTNMGAYVYQLVQQLLPSTSQPSLDPYWGQGIPNFALAKTKWASNFVRITVNESCWLGGTWYDILGRPYNADPAGNYQSQLMAQVVAATAAGMYISLDLHWNAPGRMLATAQQSGADLDNAIAFWTSMANTFKGFPNVMFEPYNEPTGYGPTGSVSDNGMANLMQGTTAAFYYAQVQAGGSSGYVYPIGVSTITGTPVLGESITGAGLGATCKVAWIDTTPGALRLFVGTTAPTGGSPICSNGTVTGSTSGATFVINNNSLGWKQASHQAIINAIRATGATNPIMLSGMGWAGDPNGWLANVATDVSPTGYSGSWVPNIGCIWHTYPALSTVTVAAIANGGSGHAVNDVITLSPSFPAQAAQVTVNTVSGGSIATYTINTPGTFYHTDCVISLAGGASIVVTAVDANGGITALASLTGTFTASQVINVPAVWAINSGGTYGTPPTASFKVTTIGGGGAITALSITQGGVWANWFFSPALPVTGGTQTFNGAPQYTTTGTGTGAVFNLTLQEISDQFSQPDTNTVLAAIQVAGYPVVISEFGGYADPVNGIGAYPLATLINWADGLGISYAAWSLQPGQIPTFTTDYTTLNPISGVGQWYLQHLNRLGYFV